MRRLSFLMLLLPSLCSAGNLPSLNSVPIFWSLLGNKPQYRDASEAAQKAFFLQSGLYSKYSMVDAYFSNEINQLTRQAEYGAAYFIDEHTPLNSKHVLFMVGASYTIFIRKEFTQGFKNPVFKRVNHTIGIGENRAMLGTQIPF